MAKDIEFKKWDFNAEEKKSLAPVKVRDLMVDCFYASQGPMFIKAKQNLKIVFTEEDIRQRAISVVQTAFRKTAGDFQKPTKDSLLKVLDSLADAAASWGTPKDVIEHNVIEMSKAISLIE